jgi:hypothetical protein
VRQYALGKDQEPFASSSLEDERAKGSNLGWGNKPRLELNDATSDGAYKRLRTTLIEGVFWC